MIAAEFRSTVLIISALSTCFVPTLAVADSMPPADSEYLAECGLECLFVASLIEGSDPGSYSMFRDRFPSPSKQGYSLYELASFGEKLGFHCYAVAASLDALAEISKRSSVIVHVEPGHYLLLIDGGKHHPPLGLDPQYEKLVELSGDRFNFTGSALIISTVPVRDIGSASHAQTWLWILGIASICTACLFYKFAGVRNLGFLQRFRTSGLLVLLGVMPTASGCGYLIGPDEFVATRNDTHWVSEDKELGVLSVSLERPELYLEYKLGKNANRIDNVELSCGCLELERIEAPDPTTRIGVVVLTINTSEARSVDSTVLVIDDLGASSVISLRGAIRGLATFKQRLAKIRAGEFREKYQVALPLDSALPAGILMAEIRSELIATADIAEDKVWVEFERPEKKGAVFFITVLLRNEDGAMLDQAQIEVSVENAFSVIPDSIILSENDTGPHSVVLSSSDKLTSRTAVRVKDNPFVELASQQLLGEHAVSLQLVPKPPAFDIKTSPVAISDISIEITNDGEKIGAADIMISRESNLQ